MKTMQKIKSEEEGRLDVVLSKGLKINRSKAQKMIENGVLVNGIKAKKAGLKVEKGAEISYTPLEEEETKTFAPNHDISLDIIYQDEAIMVINKPRGLVVHPAPGHHDDTLANALAAYYDDKEKEEDEDFRMGIVHRIDKDTSGLLVIAKTEQAKEFLSKEIAEHKVQREYLALAEGYFPHESFRVDAPLARDDYSRKKMAVDVLKGKNAVTHFKVIEQYRTCALLHCSLETGRTHQIRVHLAYIGHPIVGDPVYGFRNLRGCTNGQMLHAYKLTLTHPVTLKPMTFEAEPDEYFKSNLKRLKEE